MEKLDDLPAWLGIIRFLLGYLGLWAAQGMASPFFTGGCGEGTGGLTLLCPRPGRSSKKKSS